MRRAGAVNRLSWADLNNLAVEAPDTPMHQAVLATIDAGPLRDSDGHVRIAAVRSHFEARLDRVPELRHILLRPGLLRGRPVWIDDPDFHVENHVLSATLPPPGGEAAALHFAELELARLMDRSRPLWKVWLLDGYSNERIGLLIKLHHALADGPAMVNLLAQVFDLDACPPDKPRGPWSPAIPPTGKELLQDSFMLKWIGIRGVFRRLAHPTAALASTTSAISAMAEAMRNGRRAPRTSLNRPITGSRRLEALHLSLDDVKAVAHQHGVKVNDVFLCLVAGGLRRLLIRRGEPVAGRSIHASVAVALRGLGAPRSGNHVGVVIVPLPIDVEPASELLAAIGVTMARAKTRQLANASTALMVVMARLGITRAYIRRQHMINVLTTNLPGPPVPLYFAGARVHEPVALPPIAGNVTVSFAALSYDGGLALSLVANAAAWPDADVLVNAMRDCWRALQVQTQILRLSA